MHSIKTKLIVAISVLVIFLFSITAFLLIDEKQKELSLDIYSKARSFSELTTPKIVDLYKTLLAEKSFFIFNREMKDIFSKNEDVSQIKLYSFSGDILYDSDIERERPYEGETRKISDPDLAARVKTNLPSYALANGRTVFLKKDSDGVYFYVNQNEKEIAPIGDTDRIINIISPLDGKFIVQFDVSYAKLQERVSAMTKRIILLLVFGVLLGLGFGWYFSSRITGPIEKLKGGAMVLAKGDFTARVKVESKDEVGVLAETFNTMAGELEVSTKALVYKERMAKELELAAKIQKQILPEKTPKIPGLDIAAAIIPANEIGGDTYDFIEIEPDNHLFYLSDVTGHGIPAGIVVSIANAIIFSYSNSPNLSDILINANKVMREKTAKNMFMTILMARYKKGVLSYVSAGHPEMLHYNGAQKKVYIEKGGGIALGMVPDISKMISENTVPFGKDDCIVLYSDGIPEGLSERGEQYGMQRFKRAMNDAGELPTAEAIKNTLVADVKLFMGKAEQADDITLVVIKRTA
ncbi:MAG: SpoIIE family protein phosphatase [Candidatus Gracilibacteria bacterium]